MDDQTSSSSYQDISRPLNVIYIFILINVAKVVVSQPSKASCTLNLTFSSPSYQPSCEQGDWGGFLKKSCCGGAFIRYLTSLGLRANQTGQIYINSREQNDCLAKLKRLEGDVAGCGIEKLTSGGGGCSDFSVTDVVNKMGNNLRRLNEYCNLVNSDVKWGQSCASCRKSWEEIRTMWGLPTDSNFAEGQNGICRFAALVSLISRRIEDQTYVKRIYRCLGEQKGSIDDEATTVRKSKSKTGIWVLICALAGAAIALIAVIIILRRLYKSKARPKKDGFKEIVLKGPTCPKVPIKEVYAATSNLHESNFIGQGNAGRVYKGIMESNQHVAIKHIINEENAETVARELTSLSHVKHPNLVSLLGYCVEEDECFLIYELCPNGNLSKWLFGKDRTLSWIQRLEIAIGSAKGLHFLHTYPEGCIVHRDIKPTNVLFGPEFEAKLSDFGLSKIIDSGETCVSSEVRGTFGYVDPEYQNDRRVDSSGDVYSFGIVLLQILSGKRVINLNENKPMPLNKMVKFLSREGSIKEFVDPKLDGEYSAEAFDLALNLALSCTGVKQQRPRMEQVVSKLEEALEISTRKKASTPEMTPDWPSQHWKRIIPIT